MFDAAALREITELLIVAGASMFTCLVFVWGKRTEWEREMAAVRASYERSAAEAAEAHRIELRELDSFNAAERRRLEGRISDLEAQLAIMVKVLNERGIRMPSVTINAGGDATIGGGVAGRDGAR